MPTAWRANSECNILARSNRVLNRGDRREPIFKDAADRKRFLETLGETCAKTGWEVHAFCLMEAFCGRQFAQGYVRGRSLRAIVADVNGTLRGWYQYFQQSKRNVFATVDGYARRRLRSLLEKRRGHARTGRGAAHHRWPNEWFARRGLLSLAAEHAWTRTIAKLRTH